MLRYAGVMTAGATTLTPCRLVAINAMQVRDACTHNPRFGMELMRDHERRIPFETALGVGARVDAASQRHGLILRVVGDRLVFAPPLVIEAADIEAIGERLERALDDVAGELAREGAL